jgi:serine/threonine-protein kinase HipA
VRHLYVWLRHFDGKVSLAGELATTDPSTSGRFESEFEYSRQWTEDRASFALDPVSLPLKPSGTRFRAEQFYPPLGLFDDALPDDWGRRLIAAAMKLDGRKYSLPDALLYMRGGGTGALAFTEAPMPPQFVASTSSSALSSLLDAAAKFEAGTLPTNHTLRKLLEGSSRAGGARPKALVHDKNGEWLAKFPSRAQDESHDVVGLEATCLQLARRAGLQTPDSRLQRLGRRRVLLVKRFDIAESGGRIHMISFRTLCKEQPGIFATSYSQLVEVVRKHSAAPAADVAALYRQMVFNAAVGNVDDHLKNFWMLAMPQGYRLSPAFDLVPDITGRGEHTLAFTHGFACPSREDLRAIAGDWHVQNAVSIVDEVIAAVSGFRAEARGLKVGGGRHLERVCQDIGRRLTMLLGTL